MKPFTNNASLSSTILKIKRTAEKYSYPGDEVTQIEEDFQRMVDFFASGNYDPDKDKVYAKLCERADRLLDQVEMFGLRLSNPFFMQLDRDVRGNYTLDLEEMSNRLEDFAVDLTMLDLETDPNQLREKRRDIFSRHHNYRKQMFAQIALSPKFCDEDREAFESLILSSSIDTVDSQLMVTAIMLSCANQFDTQKAELLYNVYKKAEDDHLSQRALVSYLLSLSHNSIGDFDLNAHPLDPTLLSQIQRQVLYTIDSPRVEQIMQHDIMPDIIKNSEFDFQNNRIIQRKKDKLDDILNPHKDEEMIEKMEETMKKMKQLQEQGSDLFFGGFRHVKRHPFFNDLINWFCPFYFDHPQLPVISNDDDKHIIKNLLSRTPFCDSDKYSFFISMNQAISTIPDNIKEMLKSGDAQLDIVGGGDVIHNAAFIRRTYLQNLFRFYKICDKAAQLNNVIDFPQISHYISLCRARISEPENETLPNYDETAISTLKTLRKFNLDGWTTRILQLWTPSAAEGKIFKAFQLISRNSDTTGTSEFTGTFEPTETYKDFPLACLLFEEILAEDPHNIQALYGYTKLAFTSVTSRKPEILSSSWSSHSESAIKALLALYFKNENDRNVLLTLIKAFIMVGDNEKAEKYSREAMDKQMAEPFVLVFMAFLSLKQKNVTETLKFFKQSSLALPDITAIARAISIEITPAENELLFMLLK